MTYKSAISSGRRLGAYAFVPTGCYVQLSEENDQLTHAFPTCHRRLRLAGQGVDVKCSSRAQVDEVVDSAVSRCAV